MSARIVTIVTQIMIMAVLITFVLLFLGIGVLILIHMCIVGRALRRSLNSRTPAERGVSSSDRGNGEGMSQEEVQKLPSFEYKLPYDDNDSSRNLNCMIKVENRLWVDELDCSDCAICLDGFQRGDKCRLLPVCRHTFHAKCVDSWLYKNPLCPICRTRAQQHGGGRGKVGLKNVLELGRVEGGEMASGTRGIAIGVAVQGRLGGGWGSGFHQPEMSNLASNAPPSPRSPRTEEFVCNLMSIPSLSSPLHHGPDDDDCSGGTRVRDVMSLSQSQSHNSQDQNQNSCKLISTAISSCRSDDDDGTRGIGVLGPKQRQNQNQNSCDPMSIPTPSCRPPDDDGARVNCICFTGQSQYQNQTSCDSTLSLLPRCTPDNEGVRVIYVTCSDKNQIQSQTGNEDAMA